MTIDEMCLHARARLRVSIEANVNYNIVQMKRSWANYNFLGVAVYYGGRGGGKSIGFFGGRFAPYFNEGSYGKHENCLACTTCGRVKKLGLGDDQI